MGSSRATTAAGRRRTTQRKNAKRSRSHARPASKPRSGTAAKPKRAPAKRRPPAAKPGTKRRRPAARGAKGADRGSLLRRAVEPINLLTLAVVALCLAGTYWFWFRDSSFVAVERVTVDGITGPGSDQVTAALTEAAGSMTTLHVRTDELEAAVAPFPTVIGVEADADFPKALTITVRDRPAAMLASQGGREIAVAGDGTVLAGLDVGDAALPVVAVEKLPETGVLEGADLDMASVVGAAPGPLHELIRDVEVGGDEGVQVTLQGEVPIYFGSGERAAEKWAAAAAILAEPKLDTLTYVDVRVPERPAVGGAAPAVEAPIG